jgi:RHS repeat-associated protein
MPQLREKPHLGFSSKNPALHQVHEACNSTTALGFRAALHLERIRSRYTGKERDTESGNDYFGARYYSSAMGRFMSPDWSAKVEPVPYAKLDNPQTLNLYAYLMNNPLAGVDADGHCAMSASCYGYGCPGPLCQNDGQLMAQSQSGSAPNPAPVEQQTPDAPQPSGNAVPEPTSFRAPDFLSGNLNVAIPTPWTATLVGVTFALNIDRNGGVYFGLGPSVGKSLTMVSGSATADWMDQKSKPSAQQLNGLLTQHSFGATAGFWGGVQRSYTPGSGWATGVGFVSPQAGAGYTYSWHLFDIKFTW